MSSEGVGVFAKQLEAALDRASRELADEIFEYLGAFAHDHAAPAAEKESGRSDDKDESGEDLDDSCFDLIEYMQRSRAESLRGGAAEKAGQGAPGEKLPPAKTRGSCGPAPETSESREIPSGAIGFSPGDLRIKPGVGVVGIRPEMLLAVEVMKDACRAQGVPCVITAANVAAHTKTPSAWRGTDIEFWIRHLRDPRRAFEHAKRALGEDFDVVLESDHIHVEFQPKAP